MIMLEKFDDLILNNAYQPIVNFTSRKFNLSHLTIAKNLLIISIVGSILLVINGLVYNFINGILHPIDVVIVLQILYISYTIKYEYEKTCSIEINDKLKTDERHHPINRIKRLICLICTTLVLCISFLPGDTQPILYSYTTLNSFYWLGICFRACDEGPGKTETKFSFNPV